MTMDATMSQQVFLVHFLTLDFLLITFLIFASWFRGRNADHSKSRAQGVNLTRNYCEPLLMGLSVVDWGPYEGIFLWAHCGDEDWAVCHEVRTWPGWFSWLKDFKSESRYKGTCVFRG